MKYAQYAVMFEQAGDGGWGAYAPDFPGLGVVAGTQEEAGQLIREGILLYIEELKAEGKSAPSPTAHSEVIRVPA